jgi:hypothetical protein
MQYPDAGFAVHSEMEFVLKAKGRPEVHYPGELSWAWVPGRDARVKVKVYTSHYRLAGFLPDGKPNRSSSRREPTFVYQSLDAVPGERKPGDVRKRSAHAQAMNAMWFFHEVELIEPITEGCKAEPAADFA